MIFLFAKKETIIERYVRQFTSGMILSNSFEVQEYNEILPLKLRRHEQTVV